MARTEWSEKTAALSNASLERLVAFRFDGLPGLRHNGKSKIDEVFANLNVLWGEVVPLVTFLAGCSDKLIDACGKIRTHVANIMLNAMAFSWHIPEGHKVYNLADCVLCKLLPNCSPQMLQEQSGLMDSMSSDDFAITLQWIHSVSRHHKYPLLLERGALSRDDIRPRAKLAELQFRLANAWADRQVDHDLLDVCWFVAGLDLYRARCEEYELANGRYEEEKACDELYEKLKDREQAVSRRYWYRLASAQARKDQGRQRIVQLPPSFHERYKMLLKNSASETDRQCAFIAELNAAMAKEDASLAEKWVGRIENAAITILKHKSLMTLESGMLASHAIPQMASHFEREIRLVHGYERRQEATQFLHRYRHPVATAVDPIDETSKEPAQLLSEGLKQIVFLKKVRNAVLEKGSQFQGRPLTLFAKEFDRILKNKGDRRIIFLQLLSLLLQHLDKKARMTFVFRKGADDENVKIVYIDSTVISSALKSDGPFFKNQHAKVNQETFSSLFSKPSQIMLKQIVSLVVVSNMRDSYR